MTPLNNYLTRHKRILVLDESPIVLDVVSEALSYEHFDVSTTTNSKNFIAEVQRLKPDLLILDYKTHGPKGDEICRQIKSNSAISEIPIIICSAYLNDSKTLNCQCDAFIAKPFSLNELLEKVKGLVYN